MSHSHIINLQNELNEKNKKIEQKDLTITDLKNQLNNSKKLYDDILSKNKELQNNINQKEKELQQLKNQLNQNSNQNKNDNKYKTGFAITFRAVSQEFIHPMVCTENDILSRLEEELYNKYPEYKELNTFLTCNGTNLKRFKTVGENNIKENEAIIVNIIEE